MLNFQSRQAYTAMFVAIVQLLSIRFIGVEEHKLSYELVRVCYPFASQYCAVFLVYTRHRKQRELQWLADKRRHFHMCLLSDGNIF